MTLASERRLGDRIARELYRDPDYIDDPVIMDYVQGIWQPLLAASRLRGDLSPQLDETFAWDILLGKDRTVNAFALPGGYLGLHLGLVAIVSNRDELASVLGHELTHVTQRHISRNIAKQGAQAPWVMGAMILGVLAASKDPSAANAMIVGGQAAAAQTQLNFSRDAEREADRIGFAVMSQAGFEPQGFVTMFEKLQQSSRFNDSGGFPYLRSHPLTTERIADMQARVGQMPAGSSTAIPPPEHAMVAARARVLSNPGVDALRSWSGELEPARFKAMPASLQAGALYGACFAALKQRDFAQASRLAAQLLDLTRSLPEPYRLARLLAVEVALAHGETGLAAQQLRQMQVTGRAALFLAAETDTRSGRAENAAQNMRAWLADHPRDAQAWQLLAHANSALGRVVASVRDEAEVNMAQLDYQSAKTRFMAALELSRTAAGKDDAIEVAIVQTRARQVDLLLREQALER
jgi:predicted Zn-dependent protease